MWNMICPYLQQWKKKYSTYKDIKLPTVEKLRWCQCTESILSSSNRYLKQSKRKFNLVENVFQNWLYLMKLCKLTWNKWKTLTRIQLETKTKPNFYYRNSWGWTRNHTKPSFLIKCIVIMYFNKISGFA